MHPVATFELVLGMIVAILALHWLAARLRWPPSIALLVGGGVLAFVPGAPSIGIDPELVLVLLLPPLLADGAWNTAIARFRRHFVGILSLAVGAVIFSTAVVAAVTHWLMPSLPWSACVALGAIVAPPDAVSARAVLQRVRLPRRLSTLLEGESLLNDATGLVIFRFAVAATMGSGFDAGGAAARFVVLTVGGIAVGLAVGAVWRLIARRLGDELLLIAASVLVAWIAYIAGEAAGVSGVIATVTAGLVLGWQQHVVLSAAVRVRGKSFAQVLVFLFEASIFILIGLSLREILARAGGIEVVVRTMSIPLLAITGALILSRFAWIGGTDVSNRLFTKAGLTREPPLGGRAGLVMGWAGMRGVVTLAAALTLPGDFPGRDFILVTAFGVILVTVVAQGATLGAIIRLAGVRRTADDALPLDIFAAEQKMMRAQLVAVERLARGADGAIVHPQLLERYRARAAARDNFSGSDADRAVAIAAHFDVVIGAVGAGRAELVRLHRAHQIDEETLQSLERDLDLEELGAIAQKV